MIYLKLTNITDGGKLPGRLKGIEVLSYVLGVRNDSPYALGTPLKADLMITKSLDVYTPAIMDCWQKGNPIKKCVLIAEARADADTGTTRTIYTMDDVRIVYFIPRQKVGAVGTGTLEDVYLNFAKMRRVVSAASGP